MTPEAMALALRRIATTDDVSGLTRIAAELCRDHPGDQEAEVVARQAELKRRRIVGDS